MNVRDLSGPVGNSIKYGGGEIKYESLFQEVCLLWSKDIIILPLDKARPAVFQSIYTAKLTSCSNCGSADRQHKRISQSVKSFWHHLHMELTKRRLALNWVLKCLSKWYLNCSLSTWWGQVDSYSYTHGYMLQSHLNLDIQSHLTCSSSPRYRKCERIEKAKISRVLKPLKGMSLIGWSSCPEVKSWS